VKRPPLINPSDVNFVSLGGWCAPRIRVQLACVVFAMAQLGESPQPYKPLHCSEVYVSREMTG